MPEKLHPSDPDCNNPYSLSEYRALMRQELRTHSGLSAEDALLVEKAAQEILNSPHLLRRLVQLVAIPADDFIRETIQDISTARKIQGSEDAIAYEERRVQQIVYLAVAILLIFLALGVEISYPKNDSNLQSQALIYPTPSFATPPTVVSK